MGGFLKQATASQSRALGPFLDDTDFKTAETGLTIANTDIKLVVNGAASANKNSGGGTHRVNGVYGVTFDATDTATVGEMEVSVVVAGALPVFDKFFVIEEAIYDALYAASANAFAGAAGSTTLTALADNSIAAAKIATGAITAAKFAADAITSTVVADSTLTAAKIATGAITAAKFAAGAIDAASIAADAITAAKIADNAIDRATFAPDTGLQGTLAGTAQGGGANSITLSASASATNDLYNGEAIQITGGTGFGQNANIITAYNGTSKVATVRDTWVTNPDGTSTFVIQPAMETGADIADQVWDELQSGHTTAGTFGKYLDAAVSAVSTGGITAADIADAVCDEALSGHTAVGSVGERLGRIPNVAAGAAGGLFIAGTNAATTITTALTTTISGSLIGNVSGNVTGSVGSINGNVGGNVTGSVGSLSTQAKADVNAEVLDVLVTDTFAQPTAVPAATSSMKDKLNWLFTLGRNKLEETSTTQTLKNDAESATIATATVSDDNTTFVRSKFS